MNIYEKRGSNSQVVNDISLKNKIIKIESKINDLEKGINNILDLLKNRP